MILEFQTLKDTFKEILQSMRILPAGLWKGSALALVLDLAASMSTAVILAKEF